MPTSSAPAGGAGRLVFGHVVAGEGEDVVEECPVVLAEAVCGLLVLALGEGGIGFQVMADVGAPPLHQMPRQLAADAFPLGAVKIGGQVGEVLVEQTQEGAEGILVAAVRRGGDEHEVP